MQALVRLVDDCGYDSLWVGDHIAFAVAIFDPLLQLAQAAVVSRRLKLGTNVYLVPLRHPVPIAKQAATLDHLSEGRLIFGVGVGGEFPKEFEACGVPLGERGARLTAAIPLLRQLWSGEPVSYGGRYFGGFAEVLMQPARQPGGPPISFSISSALTRSARNRREFCPRGPAAPGRSALTPADAFYISFVIKGRLPEAGRRRRWTAAPPSDRRRSGHPRADRDRD